VLAQTWTFGKKIAFGFGLAVVMLLLVAGVAYRSTDALIANNHQVTHSHEVLESLGQVLSLMKDAETGQRGYLLTGNETYLEPYTASIGSVAALVDRLRALTADSPSQQGRLGQAAALIDAKLAELKLTVELRRTQGLDVALKEVERGTGKSFMDDLRKVMGAMDLEERALLKQRGEAAEAGAKNAETAIALGALLALIAVTAAGFIITTSLGRQLGSAVSGIRSASAELEADDDSRAAFDLSADRGERAARRAHRGGDGSRRAER
jgi:CHASE3 domain sensor protein